MEITLGMQVRITGDHHPYNQSDEPFLFKDEIVTIEDFGADGRIYVRRANGELQATIEEMIDEA